MAGITVLQSGAGEGWNYCITAWGRGGLELLYYSLGPVTPDITVLQSGVGLELLAGITVLQSGAGEGWNYCITVWGR